MALCLLALGGPLPSARSEDAPKLEVSYCQGGGETLLMDLYPPRVDHPGARPGPAPVLLYIHGGGWQAGSRKSAWGGDWARHGYLFAAIDYRLAPQHRFPAMIEDAKCAVRYLRAHAKDYHLDPDRIAVWGDSAGGHLAALLGLTGPEAGFEGSGGWPGVSSQVQAVVDMFGPSDLLPAAQPRGMDEAILTAFGSEPEALRRGSPLSWLRANAPPFLILHGRQDDVVPLSQSQVLYERLQALGAPAELLIVEQAGHGITETSRPSAAELDARIMAFLDGVFQHRGPET